MSPMKPNPAMRITFSKKERARALALATAKAESESAYTEYVTGLLKDRNVDIQTSDWNYNPLTGIAVRTR